MNREQATSSRQVDSAEPTTTKRPSEALSSDDEFLATPLSPHCKYTFNRTSLPLHFNVRISNFLFSDVIDEDNSLDNFIRNKICIS